MTTSTVVSRVRRSGSVPSTVRVAAARAGVFSVAGTVLAVAGHHVVFDVSPSWAARGILAGFLFAVALPGAAQPSSAVRQLVLGFGAQGLGVCWFTANTAPAYERLSSAWPMVLAHVAMTALLAHLLHGAQDGRLALFRVVAAELRSLCAWLWSLLFPRVGADVTVVEHVIMPDPSGPARASPRAVALADCLVRRGPPSGVPLAA
ncbi:MULTISPECIES: hypothetical protein [unclassified Streptomyces]|uniref:hypothetical protein n=1 Tax=unclassified Streptomyces TaxID=2593676 RepID=UPI002E7FF14A|nr:hypothetical protein [Streptomyces sp. NBC_00589]WTI35065.1 hypothetical protein OIC96_08720 [Streptomyces sp. NBC_00775]WUB31261.1 hypothetical protein OHA51_41010 [Streptomyces sp. NBC_00589]